MIEVSAFDGALAVCWALVVAVVLLRVATRDGTTANPKVFVRGGLGVMVAIQFFYLYQAARLALPRA